MTRRRVPALLSAIRTPARPRVRRALRRTTAVLATATLAAAVLTGLAASPAAAAPPEGPAGDAFYVPPDPLPPGQPGDVIWKRTLSSDTAATTYLVLYRSTTARGAPTAVSGTVRIPRTGAATAPIVGIAPPTTGLGDQCAASKEALVSDVSVPPAFTQRGYVLATTDYEGLGTPGVHTYVVGRSEGHAVLDVVRAAQRLGAGPTASSPVGFYGYSQGGGGAAWAAQQARSYAPELQVKGTAAGGIPADMVAVGRALDGGLGFGFLAAAAAGFDAAYPELDLDAYLNATGRQVFAGNVNRCVTDIIAQLAFHRIAEYTTSNPMDRPDWQARLRENSLGAVAPSAPIFIWHGLFDEILPYDQDAALWRTYCRNGGKVTFQATFDEHVTGALGGMTGAAQFLADRFAGKPATDNCWLSGA